MIGLDKNDAAVRARFAERLVAARIALGMTQKALGVVLGMRPGPMNALEKGRHLPNARTLRAICHTLHVSADWLLDINHANPPARDKSALRIAELEKRIKHARSALDTQ